MIASIKNGTDIIVCNGGQAQKHERTWGGRGQRSNVKLIVVHVLRN